MREFPRIMTDVNCGWNDDVGSSITSRALGYAHDQQQACDALKSALEAGENVDRINVSYDRMGQRIDSCRID